MLQKVEKSEYLALYSSNITNNYRHWKSQDQHTILSEDPQSHAIIYHARNIKDDQGWTVDEVKEKWPPDTSCLNLLPYLLQLKILNSLNSGILMMAKSRKLSFLD